MPIITVRDLRKTFQTKRKQPGLMGSLKAVVKPELQTVEAVKGISFELEPGELLAFIGPNGAGKSTTIKMLTGILYPSGGQAGVLGLTPWKDRRRLAYRIGSVFGQKPQLWYHLPPADTFHLFARIYELDEAAFKERLGFLVEAFDIGDLLNTPVRKLSLGQRMKCEIAASLLHRPQVIFLDEPTIGLDVVAKQQIRDTIKLLHEREGTTIFLTSHDAGDIESLCKRAIIINYGQVIYDDRVSALKRRYLTRKVVDVRFAERLENGFVLEGVEVLKVGDYGVKLQFDTRTTPVESVLQRLLDAHLVADITVNDPPMEEIIRDCSTFTGVFMGQPVLHAIGPESKREVALRLRGTDRARVGRQCDHRCGHDIRFSAFCGSAGCPARRHWKSHRASGHPRRSRLFRHWPRTSLSGLGSAGRSVARAGATAPIWSGPSGFDSGGQRDDRPRS